MEKKTMWTLVLVFAVGLIFGSLAGNNTQLTGQQSGQQSLGLGNPDAPKTAVITVEPEMVSVGGRIEVTVIPGINGVESSDGTITIHTLNDLGEPAAGKLSRLWLCRKEVCYDPGTVEFVVPSYWSPGIYAAVVSDPRTGETSRADFRIE